MLAGKKRDKHLNGEVGRESGDRNEGIVEGNFV